METGPLKQAMWSDVSLKDVGVSTLHRLSLIRYSTTGCFLLYAAMWMAWNPLCGGVVEVGVAHTH